MADCEYQIAGDDRIYSESEFKKLLSEGYLDKVMLEKQIKVRGIKPNEELAKSFQLPSAIQPAVTTEVKTEETIQPTVTTEDISTKKANIEKKREDELKAFENKNNVGNLADGKGDFVIDLTSPDGKKYKNEVNAKYDAELSKLEATPTEPVTDLKSKSVDELEKRQFEIEESRNEEDRKEFNEIDKELEKREWNSVLNAPLNKVNKVLDDLDKKNKEMPNGFGSYIERSDIRQSKAIINKYSGEVSKQEALEDFKDAFFGNPTSWYADGLKLRESTRAYTEQGGSFKDLLSSVQREFASDGFTEQDAASVINRKLQEIQNKGLEQATTTEPVTKAEEKVTEPTAEVKEVVSDDRVAEEYAKSTNSDIEAAKKSISDVEKYNNGEMSPKEYLESQGYSEKNFFEVGADREIKDFSDLTEEEFKEVADRKANYTNNRINDIKQKVQAEPVTEPTAEVTPETKQPTKEAVAAKNMADILRKAKIKMEGGTAMASFLPGFDKVWSATIETVAKAIELGGITAGNFRQSIEAGMKALKQTDAYKAITDPKERAKISARYKKILTSAYSEGYDIDTDKLREAEFNDFNQKLEDNKGKTLSAKEFNALKSEAKKFVNDNLPADSYRKSEVQSYVRNNFDKAKTVEDIQKNLDKVNSIMTTKEAKIEEKEAKQAEKKEVKDRSKLISDIENIIANNSRKVISKNRRTGAKKGKISIQAQQQINQTIQDLKDQGLFKNLDKLSTQELTDLKTDLDNIITTGRAEQKQLKALDEAKKKSDKAMILRSLSKKPDEILNGKEEIEEKLKKENGHVIVNDQLMSASDFNKFISSKENKDADLSNVEFYRKRNIDEVKGKLEKETSIRRKIRDITLFNIKDAETYVRKLIAGSPALRKWVEDNIMKPAREAKRKEIESNWRLTKQYLKETKEIFGTYTVISQEFVNNKWKNKTIKVSKMYDTLAAPTGIVPKNSTESISADQAVTLYSILYNTNDEVNKIYKLDPNTSEKDMRTLIRENYISPEAIYDFMHKPENKALLDYAHLLAKKYNVEAREIFGPTIEQLRDIALGNEYYHPHLRSVSALESKNIMDLEGQTSLSVLAPSMRHTEEKASAPFKLIGAHELYLNYMKSMTHSKEYIPVVKSIYTLLSDENKPYLMEKLGSVSDYNDFVKCLGIMVADRLPFESGAMSGFANYTAMSMLWFRINAIPKQMTSMAHFYTAGIKDGVYPWDVAAAVPTNKDELKFVGNFYADNPYLWTRMSGGNITPEMNKLKEQIDSLSNRLSKGLLSFAQFTGLLPIKAGDFVAAASPGGGMSFALAQFKKKFNETGDYQLSRDHAIQRWFEETERTNQVSQATEIMSTKSFDKYVRLFFPFSSAQQGVGKKAYKAYLDIKDFKNLNNKEKAQAIADIIYYPLAAPVPFLLSGAIGYAIYQMIFDDEEDEISDAEKKRVFYDLIMDSAQSHGTALGLPGLIFNFTTNIARDRTKYNQGPTYQRLTDIGIELVSLLKANKTWDDLTINERKTFLKDYVKENGPLKGKKIEDIYNDTFLNEKLINELLKAVGAANIKKTVEDVEKVSKAEDFSDYYEFATGVQTKRNEENKKFIPYLNDAVKYGKQDEVYEFLERAKRSFVDENYTPEEYIPGELQGPKPKARKSGFQKPGKFKTPSFKPRIPKF